MFRIFANRRTLSTFAAVTFTGTYIFSHHHHHHHRSHCENVDVYLDDCKRRKTIEGKWTQDKERSESMGPFLVGLGVPSFMVWFLDAVSADLEIKFVEKNAFEVNDHTIFGTNSTRVVLGADEVEKSTRTGRKKFMLSGVKDTNEAVTLQCRLTSRGDGWYTRQSFYLLDDSGDFLCERFELETPDSEDNISVTRVFRRLDEDIHYSSDESIFPNEKSTKAKQFGWAVAAISAISVGAYVIYFSKNDAGGREIDGE